MSNATDGSETGNDEVLDLGRATLKILLLHVLGYLAATTGLFSKAALGGLGQFVKCFALPMLLFEGLATIDFDDVVPSLLLVVIISKSCIFAAAAFLGYLTQGGLRGAGLLALCSTMSDDVGLGVPLLTPLFGAGRVRMLYILSALQAILLNPIAYVLLALGAPPPSTPSAPSSKKASPAGASAGAPAADGTTAPAASPAEARARPNQLRAVVLRVARDTLTNPLVVSCLLGAVYRVTIGMFVSESRAWFVFDTTSLVGGAFTPLVLFLAGASLVGSLGSLTEVTSLALPLGLVALKSMLLPALTSALAEPLHADAVFSFEYGALSTATSAYVIVGSSGAPVAQLRGVSASLATGKAFCFLIVFVYAGLLRTMSVQAMFSLTAQFAFAMHGVGAIGNVWVLGGALLDRATWHACPTLRSVAVLAILQLAFSTSFLSIGQERFLSIPSRREQCLLYMLVAMARWTLNGWHLIVAADVSLRSTLSAHPPLPQLPTSWASMPTRMLIAAAVGVAATVPWPIASAFTLPVDPGLALWVPFGRSQEIAYASAYFAVALFFTSCVVVTLLASTRRARTISSQDESGATPPPTERIELNGLAPLASDDHQAGDVGTADEVEAARLHAIEADARLKSRGIGCIALVRAIGECVLCVELASHHDLTLASAQLTLLMVALEDAHRACIPSSSLASRRTSSVPICGHSVQGARGCRRRASDLRDSHQGAVSMGARGRARAMRRRRS